MRKVRQAASIAIVGGGPAGLMAAEVARAGGAEVDVYEQMPSVARKFLIAGKGGLNLTHSEDFEAFVARFSERAPDIRRWLTRFDADALRAWAQALGYPTIVGSSGRVFPADLKAGPMLRSWVRRLRASGVRIHGGHRWSGFSTTGELLLEHAGDTIAQACDAVVLALGGGSWSKLGSDGGWVPILTAAGVDSAPLRPTNCGFECALSEFFRQRFAGQPVKSVGLSVTDERGQAHALKGEFLVTEHGIEGSAVYALGAVLRDTLERTGACTLVVDLLPDHTLAQAIAALARPRGTRSTRSFSEHLRRTLGVHGVKAGLLYESVADAGLASPERLAATLKAVPIPLLRPRPLDEAISTAGGVRFEALDEGLMLRALPGVHCAGEMLDWEAPTGGYLLTACFASGVVAAEAALRYCTSRTWGNASPRAPD
jgi:uncharacterized flavoprotein (TIGR03862 family)